MGKYDVEYYNVCLWKVWLSFSVSVVELLFTSGNKTEHQIRSSNRNKLEIIFFSK